MIKRDGVIVWTQYFDKNLTRAEGRRVKLSLAVKNPTQDRIIAAAKKLGWKAEPLNKSHPSQWWKKGAAVIIYPTEKEKKTRILELLASRLSGG